MSALPQFPANNTPAYVQLKACYSNYSIVDRPWRAYNNVITVRNQALGPSASTAMPCFGINPLVAVCHV